MAPPKKNKLAKWTLVSRLLKQNPTLDEKRFASASHNWLVNEARDRGLITPEEATASVELEFVTMKRYLRTCLDASTDAAFLDAIDAYVQMASKIRSAGSQLVNLFAIEAFERGYFNGGFVLKGGRVTEDESDAECDADNGEDDVDMDDDHDDDGEEEDAAKKKQRKKDFVGHTLLNQTFIKYCLLPFKSELTQQGGCPAALRDVFDVYAAHLIQHSTRFEYIAARLGSSDTTNTQS